MEMQTFGAYRATSLLGEGGMGAVYLAEHTLLGRRAAIKVLRPEFSQREEVVERFFNEARAASSISDPGIIQIFDFGYQDATAYIVMEFLDGESLDARLERLRRLPVDEVLRIGRQLALSLQTAHASGVIHRDLKPENIFLVPDAEVAGGERTKILDFGIAKLTDERRSTQQTQAGLVFGTPLYMSPEQCRGAGAVDHRSDIYSLGCLLFHLACGRPPFDAEGAGELLSLHLTASAPKPSALADIPPHLEQVLATCLAKRPQHRYQSMYEVAAALVEPAEPADLEQLEVRRPRRWLFAVAIGSVLAAGAVIGGLTLANGEAAAPRPAAAVAAPAPAPLPTVVEPTPEPPPAPPPVVVAEPPPEPPPPTSEARAVVTPTKHRHERSHHAIATPETPGPITTPEPAPAPAPVPEPPPPDDPYGDR